MLVVLVEQALRVGRGVRVALEQRADLGLAVSAVTAERANRGELAGLSPTSDRLGVNTEKRRYL
jgi:hypothetical protein